ncbi:4Fe-4S dicluster domain-containing protein [Leptospira ilyithenensis]|uniref:4Fe-4S dicluster domain-containing protein n=1 Tax=Leptospira ilyithenensis TaxID=2484901 RepID=A0A4R9LV57_9LEPT|nr:4Fe-4S dicluster domain-containing protein [Leptospira ilyithenensis]TGN14389.1 4Fe-4S dicluster domain-containing protein [Leptospira ilyithenensis]
MRSLLEIKNIFSPSQIIDWKKASPVHPKNRGIPVPTLKIKEGGCNECKVCETECPTHSVKILSNDSIRFDYGACLQCGSCVTACGKDYIKNSGFLYVFSKDRDSLRITYTNGEFTPEPEPADTAEVAAFRKLTRTNGFLYREVAAAGNNSVECELNASFNSVFDSEREGVRIVASPKHADAVVFSGPVSKGMEGPLSDAWEVMAGPKALIACGTEAVSGGLYPKGKRPKEPDLFIGGDPPRPDVVLQAFRYLMGRFSFSFQEALHKYMQSEK